MAAGPHLDVVSFPLLVAASAVGAFLPLVFGLWAAARIQARGGRAARLLPAFSFGVALFLFVDLIDQTAELGRGTRDAGTLLALSGAFLLGVLLFAALARGSEGNLALAWAFGLGLHGLGEGLVLAADYLTGNLHLDAFQGGSYALHKFFEGASIVALLAAAARPNLNWYAWAALIAAGPVVVGVLLPVAGVSGGAGLLVFAVGAGANALALLSLGARSGFGGGWPVAVATALGALSLFFAGVLHEH